MEVIKVENLYKQYRLGQVSTGSIAHDLNRWWHKVRGKEDPYEKITGVNNREDSGSNDYVWALQDINFSVKQGEVLGIIGRNGAGKSTLLKILSKVTSPTKGNIKVKGRIASLLEVGTGFHPELTGRENIFLNGAILGMTKSEIRSKFDEIVAFSGVEKYIDTPVKRYSSGMYVRLAFAVAAHLEPEILIVDEVLAVGDAEFQKKCLGKMKDVSGEGRTVLFVSHNLTAVENLCSKALCLSNGLVFYEGEVREGINQYLTRNRKSFRSIDSVNLEDKDFTLIDFQIYQNELLDNFLTNHEIYVKIEYEVNRRISGLRVGYDLTECSSENVLFRSYHDDNNDNHIEFAEGKYLSISKIPSSLLKQGDYQLSLSIGIHNVRWIIFEKIAQNFNVVNIGGINKLYADQRPGVIMPMISWSTNLIK